VEQSRRVLFARVSWMKRYDGLPGDKPSSTMSYVTGNDGPVYERYNFQPVGGWVYGYFAHSRETVCHLEKVAPDEPATDHLDNVLIIFIAKRPHGKQTVVGWYQDAILYPKYHIPAPTDRRFRNRQDWAYCCKCLERNAILLCPHERNWEVPHRKGGMSSAKIRYFDPTQPWMTNIIHKIDAYPDVPIENVEDEDLEDLVVDAFEEARTQRQGYQLDTQLRRNIEDYAILVAKKAYEKRGYQVEKHTFHRISW
jgi:hypothetical protein